VEFNKNTMFINLATLQCVSDEQFSQTKQFTKKQNVSEFYVLFVLLKLYL